ncbi:MAG: SIMPL domain-containing protein [Luteimonas sp.]
MSRFTLRPLWLATALASSLIMTSACAQNAPTPGAATPGAATPGAHVIPADGTLLSVSAQAESKRVPDVATMSTGVVTQAADANTAMRQNAEQMAKVVAAIKASGVAERDIQTSGISVNPQYRYAENQPPTITGYQATNTVNMKVRDIGKLGKVLDTLVAQGANQVNGPSFEVDKPDEAYDEARLLALKKAEARARTYADAMGLRVRRIVSISEGAGFQPPMPMMRMQAMDATASKETSVSPGETTLSANLDVVFELGK